MSDLPPVTPELKPLAAMLGSREAVLALIEARGGRKLYLPQGPERSALTEILGAAVVERLARQWGGDRLRVPLGRAWRIQVYRARGMSIGDIAARLCMTEIGVYRSLRQVGLAGNVPEVGAGAASPQLDLFR
jgi:Mor family transcriptional regulator